MFTFLVTSFAVVMFLTAGTRLKKPKETETRAVASIQRPGVKFRS